MVLSYVGSSAIDQPMHAAYLYIQCKTHERAQQELHTSHTHKPRITPAGMSSTRATFTTCTIHRHLNKARQNGDHLQAEDGAQPTRYPPRSLCRAS